MNRLLTEEEFKDMLAKKLEAVLLVNRAPLSEIGRAVKPEKKNSLENTIRRIKNRSSLPSLYSFYGMVYAIPGLNPTDIFLARKKGYVQEDGSVLVAAEPETTYEVIKPWAQEKMALLERINDMSDELRRCYKENRELREKLSDTRP